MPPVLGGRTDLSGLAEQMCRIEHKLDLIILYLATKDGSFELRRMADGVDPLTHERTKYYMDLFKGHVVRMSSDGTTLVPPSQVLFNQTTTPGGTSNDGSEGSGDPG